MSLTNVRFMTFDFKALIIRFICGSRPDGREITVRGCSHESLRLLYLYQYEHVEVLLHEVG
jgi:hypothetical protein